MIPWRYRALPALLAVACYLGPAAPARAQPDPRPPRATPPDRPAPPRTANPGPPKPWQVGVTPVQRARALELFREGNGFFVQRKFAQALALYERALQQWQHPSIQYNKAVALIHLKKPLEAGQSLLKALRFGQGPLTERTHLQALTYKKLLFGQLYQLKVICHQPGAVVMLDGKPLFTGPGEVRKVVLPGPHKVTARKPGYVGVRQDLSFTPGRETVVTLKMIRRIKKVAKRRFKNWVPWTVFASGAVAGVGLGLAILFKANRDFKRFDESVIAGNPNVGLRDQATAERIGGFTLLGLGAAVTMTGVVLLLLNRTKVVSVKAPTDRAVRLTPSLGPGGVSLSVDGRF